MKAVSLNLKMFLLMVAVASVAFAESGNGKIEGDREARMRMVRERAYCGVWGEGCEFNSVNVRLDPSGKGLLSGCVIGVFFNWVADDNGAIACSVDPELFEFMPDDCGQPPDRLDFSFRYLPESNALAIVDGGAFFGSAKSEPLRFRGNQPEVQDAIRRFCDERDRRYARRKAQWDDFMKDKVVETVTNRCESLDALFTSLTSGGDFTMRMISVATEVEGLCDCFLFRSQHDGFFRVELEIGRSGVGSRPPGFEGYMVPSKEYRQHPWMFPSPTQECRTGIEEFEKRWSKCGGRSRESSFVTKGRNLKLCRDVVAFELDEKQVNDAEAALSARFTRRFPCDIVVSTIRPK